MIRLSRPLSRATTGAALAMAMAGAASCPAAAQEVFGGIYKHGVDTPFTFDTGEGGVDVAAGIRFDGIDALDFIGSPEPYILGSLNTRGDTSFGGVGLAWTIGRGPVYLRPGIGVVVHDAPELRVDPQTRIRTDLGSRVLFEPEIGVGYRLNERASVEAHWMHISQGQIFDSQQNPGIDMIGARVNWKL